MVVFAASFTLATTATSTQAGACLEQGARAAFEGGPSGHDIINQQDSPSRHLFRA